MKIRLLVVLVLTFVVQAAWSTTASGAPLTNTAPGLPTGGASVVAPKPEKARLLPNGRAVAPPSAPPRVRKVIKHANQIRRQPYVWGGGHGSFRSNGYDCSGAVSFALKGGEFIRRPLTSGELTSWGRTGKGNWITVYANGQHTYAVIAGLRWDTSDTGGKGPRWHKSLRSNAGFAARHPAQH